MRGGIIPQRSYMVRGGPGSGKTMLGLHFLTEASDQGLPVLFITFGESEGELRRNGGLLGFDLDPVTFLDLSPASQAFGDGGQDYDIFPPSEVERDPLAGRIRSAVVSLKPVRVFVDGLTQLRYLSSSPFQFRKEALAFLRFLCEMGATVLFTSESNEGPDEDLQFIADGVIQLELVGGYRRASVVKFRGSGFRAGYHTMALADDGMEVFPRLLPDDFSVEFEPDQIPF